MKNKNYDVLIIGDGVVDCAIARKLSYYKLSIALLEKEADVGWGASCRNTGVVHAGFSHIPGSLKAMQIGIVSYFITFTFVLNPALVGHG